MACNSSITEDGYCRSIDKQLLVSNYNQISIVLAQTALVFAVANIGKLSDKFGRKPFIFLIAASVMVSRILLYISYECKQTFQMPVYLVCDFISSFAGGLFGMIGLTNSYITDIVDPEKRVHLIGFGTGAIFTGEALGPLVSNLLVHWLQKFDTSHEKNTFTPMLFLERSILLFEIVVFSFLCWYVFFILPESNKDKRNINRSDLSFSPCKYFNIFQPLSLLTLPTDLVMSQFRSIKVRIRIIVGILICVSSLATLLTIGMSEIILQYGIYKYQWKTVDVALFMTVFATARVVSLFGISPFVSDFLLEKKFNFKPIGFKMDSIDVFMIFIGLIFESGLYFGMDVAQTSAQYFAAFILGSLGAIIAPITQSTILKYFPKAKAAEIVMALSLVNAISTIIVPPILLSVYKHGLVVGQAGLPFTLCLMITLGEMVLALVGSNIKHTNIESSLDAFAEA